MASSGVSNAHPIASAISPAVRLEVQRPEFLAAEVGKRTTDSAKQHRDEQAAFKPGETD